MNYYVADTYKYMERVGEPFEKNGKPYTKVVGTCDRCGGSGVFACRVENGHIVPPSAEQPAPGNPLQMLAVGGSSVASRRTQQLRPAQPALAKGDR